MSGYLSDADKKTPFKRKSLKGRSGFKKGNAAQNGVPRMENHSLPDLGAAGGFGPVLPSLSGPSSPDDSP